ncbi:hypothetical protein [Prosthecobacter sp.]|uniref:hypothetical protein n=1 Tax=Prosthecobacter sp. TaxID=1965333 RepID=UPI0037841774
MDPLQETDQPRAFSPQLVFPWLGLVVLHLICMGFDWHLRDASMPTRGGLSDGLVSAFQISTLLAFGLGIFFVSPARWHVSLRILSAFIQSAAALGLMIFAWFWYVIGHGIDTL